MNFRLARKNREVDPQSWVDLYGKLVSQKIHKRYSIDQELAILRKRDSNPEEFAEYFAYAEECKAQVKEEMEQ